VNKTLTRVAMTTAGLMLAHQVAAKALRDTTFLTAWPATALPLMTIGTAALTATLVPLFSRFLERFSSSRVVSIGFALSAGGHALEWAFFDAGRWIAVIIYLHIAGVGAVLLSGFWSLIAERFDPAGARTSYGRITAAGTAGGMVGSIAAERLATMVAPGAVLIMLAALHLLCAAGVTMLRRSPALLPREKESADAAASGLRETFRTPYLRTIAAFVILTSASSAILDFLLKSEAKATFATGPELLRFFTFFYGAVQVVSFLAQTRAESAVRRFGMAGAINALPGGVGAVGLAALVFPAWPVITALRGLEAVLHNSLFRSGYELLFVPMDARMRNRAKTVLDVLCDRAGEAAGSGIVQLVLVAGVASIASSLLTVSLLCAAVALWVGQRFGSLYVGLVEGQLLKYRDEPQVSMISEAGWTLLQVPGEPAAGPAQVVPARPAPVRTRRVDPSIELIAELRSRDVARVSAALGRTSMLGRIHVAQIVDLLAWDAVLPAARSALEQLAPLHLGMLIDAMLDPLTDFAIRRRLPRILGTVATRRSLDGLVNGLGDLRFEVRYHCSRAISHILSRNRNLPVDRAQIIAAVERELSIPPQRWRGYRLLDRPEVDGLSDLTARPEDSSRYLEHIVLLLSAIVGRDPLDAAVHGVRSADPGVRGLAFEYLDQVLPPAIVERLKEMIASTPSGGDAPGQSAPQPIATRSSGEH
jgi:ATP:ADP antiporter, AAA family